MSVYGDEQSFLDVRVLSEPRQNEFDFEMKQAIRDMPFVRVFGADKTLAEAIQTAIDQLSEDIEVVRFYRSGPYGDPRVRFVVLPDENTDDAAVVAWTKLFNDPIYGVREDGSLNTDDGYHENITIGDLRRSAHRFGNGSNDRIVLIAPTGLGDATVYHDVVVFLLDHALEYGIAAWTGIGWLRRRLARRRALRDARETAAALAHGGVEQPWQLRAFIDRRDEWDLAQLARLLRLSPTFATRILRAVGYAPRRDGMWVRGESRRAARARQRWIHDEMRNDWR